MFSLTSAYISVNANNGSDVYFYTPEREIEEKYPETLKDSFVKNINPEFIGIVHHGDHLAKSRS